MKFISIKLSNLFAYRGPSEIDLGDCTAEKNIVLISGANGAGKTSLLNAIKLLFVGSADDRVRRVIHGQGPLPPKQFVLGSPGRWFGVFNKEARRAGEPASVSIEWTEGEHRFKAERRFSLLFGGADYAEVLVVSRDGIDFDDAAGRRIMRELLPHEVVPFFFFDGEQIQSIADAQFGREQAEIERLLGLAFMNNLTKEVAAFASTRKSAGLPTDVQAQIADAEGRAGAAQAKAEAARAARIVVEEEQQELEVQKSSAKAEREALRGGITDNERKRMLGRIRTVSGEREKIAGAFAQNAPPEAHFLTNLRLVERGFGLLESALDGTADALLAARLHRQLPDELIQVLKGLAPPVTLLEVQKDVFKSKISGVLTAAGVDGRSSSHPVFDSLSPRRLKELRDQFFLWQSAGAEVAAHQADQLRKLRALLHEERALVRELHEAEITDEADRRRYSELSDEIDGLDLSIQELVAEATKRGSEEAASLEEAIKRREEIERLYVRYDDLVAKNRTYQLARKVKAALSNYRDERRRLIRSSVEDRLNEHVAVLLARSQLIRSVKLSDQFSITYQDEDGEEVARFSLSAGMRQLAAMAMLWALKDEAARPLPVVIDTPLGRIDEENRNLLISEYFPNAGNPLVLLPTNSELGAAGTEQLSEYVAKRYVIENTGGTNARIVPQPIRSIMDVG